MNKYSFPIYIIFLVAASAFLISGCSTYLATISDPAILSRSPTIEATGVPSNETMTLTFNKKMNTDLSQLQNWIRFYNQYDTALYPATYESISWSSDGKTLTILNPGEWLGGDGSRVYWTASKEGFRDENGNYLMEGTVLFNYYMSGFGIVGRSPYYGEGNITHPRTLEVTFSSPISIESYLEFPFTASSEHTAGMMYPFPPTIDTYYLSNGNRTINMYISSYDAAGQVAIIVSPESQIWNESKTDSVPGGTFMWYYQNNN